MKNYWLRGMGVGLAIYATTTVIALFLLITGLITCNAFVTQGPMVKESLLCGPVIFFTIIPVMIITELVEDIEHANLTHADSYLMFLGVLIIYFGVFAFLGGMYGKQKSN